MISINRALLTAVASDLRAHGHDERAAIYDGPRVEADTPDARTAYAESVMKDLTQGQMTWAHRGPGNGYRLTLHGELLALPDQVVESLQQARNVEVLIGSCHGGDLRAARRILTTAGDRLAHVHVDLYAASAAALLVASAPGRRTMQSTAELMLHPPAFCVMGDVDLFRACVRELELMTADWVTALVTRTGQTREVVEPWLTRGNVRFSAAQALAAGLVDEVIG